jgi:hypothetical protein
LLPAISSVFSCSFPGLARALAAENLFVRKQLALFQERKLKPHCAHDFQAADYGHSGAHVLLA